MGIKHIDGSGCCSPDVEPTPVLTWTLSDPPTLQLEVNGRPLVVIDPEDREQVARIVAILHAGDLWFGGGPNQPTHTSLLQKALREFAEPTPPIIEPEGIGAVVEDIHGALWVSTAHGGPARWIRARYTEGEDPRSVWSALPAVKVLSEGWSE